MWYEYVALTRTPTALSRFAFAEIARVLTATTVLAGCAQSPTAVITVVGADDTVPPVALVQATVTSVSHPSLQSTAQAVSLRSGDGGMPGPFPFPIELYIGVDPSFAGDVEITVQALDWNTGAVVAAGSVAAQVVAHDKTQATVTLTATCAAAAPDAGLSCDGSAGDAGGASDTGDAGDTE
ncbi:MAG TPA: hypothetical protein VE987_06880 [Polyangiaceae bacterium]|nr:hypothetical protein [Polyangiaceae bacterium]